MHFVSSHIPSISKIRVLTKNCMLGGTEEKYLLQALEKHNWKAGGKGNSARAPNTGTCSEEEELEELGEVMSENITKDAIA